LVEEDARRDWVKYPGRARSAAGPKLAARFGQEVTTARLPRRSFRARTRARWLGEGCMGKHICAGMRVLLGGVCTNGEIHGGFASHAHGRCVSHGERSELDSTT
jgi:hypothetical protein